MMKKAISKNISDKKSLTMSLIIYHIIHITKFITIYQENNDIFTWLIRVILSHACKCGTPSSSTFDVLKSNSGEFQDIVARAFYQEYLAGFQCQCRFNDK